MDQNIIISSSILSADFSQLGNQISQAEKAGVDMLHVDVMDGHFVPNISMGPFIVDTCKNISQLPIDVHLMIFNPEHHIDAFKKAGANRISIHVENNPNVHRTLQAIQALGCHPGIVINPGTSINSISSVLDMVEFVLVMTVNPGFSGQSFLPSSIKKIEQLSELISQTNPQVLIQVDGGITPENIKPVYQAGARIFVAATSIFKNPDGIAAGVASLRSAVC